MRRVYLNPKLNEVLVQCKLVPCDQDAQASLCCVSLFSRSLKELLSCLHLVLVSLLTEGVQKSASFVFRNRWESWMRMQPTMHVFTVMSCDRTLVNHHMSNVHHTLDKGTHHVSRKLSMMTRLRSNQALGYICNQCVHRDFPGMS